MEKLTLPSLETYLTPKTKLNERQELTKQFVEKLNSERGLLPPLEAKNVALLMAYIKTEDLRDFYKECETKNSFSKFWWYVVKPKQ